MFKLKTKPAALSVAVSSAMALSLLAVPSAHAQRALEEIVVTAERREATAQTTSISMVVFDNESLANAQIISITDLQNAMPGIQIMNNGPANDINIRGIGSSVWSPQVMQGVAVVKDGVAHGEPMGLNGAFFDIGTIEVLRGPQGTFVGQSAAGGAIMINTANPDFDGVHGYVDTGIGNYGLNTIQGAVNMPISDTWAARVAFNSDRRDSYYTNLGSMFMAGGDPQRNPGALDNRQLRFSLLYEPNDQFRALFKAERSTTNNYGDVRQPKQRANTGFTIGDHDNDPSTPDQVFEAVTYAQYRNYSPADPFTVIKMWPGEDFQENTQFTLNLSYELPNEMVVAYTVGQNDLFTREEYWSSLVEPAGAPRYPNHFQLGPKNISRSHDITLASPEGDTNWIVGLFYTDRWTPVRFQNAGTPFEVIPNHNCGWQSDGTHVDCGDLVMPRTFTHGANPAYIRSMAVFGQINHMLTDELEFTLGARYNDDKSTNRTNVFFRVPTDMAANLAPPFSEQLCEDLNLFGTQWNNVQQQLPNVQSGYSCFEAVNNKVSTDTLGVDNTTPTWKVGLNWTPTDEDYFYIFYARGYKAGTSQGGGVAPEIVDDYEFGWKGTKFDGRLRSDVGFFYMDYQDMQSTAFNTRDPLGAQNVNTNVGDATIWGFEASAQLFLGNWGFNVSGSYTNSRIDEISLLNTGFLPSWADNPLAGPGVPAFKPQCGVGGTGDQATSSNPNGDCFDYSPLLLPLKGQEQVNSPELAYNISIDYAFELRNGGTLTPRASWSHTDRNYANFIQNEYYKNDSRDLLNLSLTYTDETWTVQAYMNNVEDRTYVASAWNNLVSYGAPKTYGFRVRMNF